MKYETFEALSFIGAFISVFFGFVNLGSGGILIKSGNGFNGVVTLISGLGCLAAAYLIYRNFNKELKKKKAENNDLYNI